MALLVMSSDQITQVKSKQIELVPIQVIVSEGLIVGRWRRVTDYFHLPDVPVNSHALKWEFRYENHRFHPHFSLRKHRCVLPDLMVIPEVMDGDMTGVLSGRNYYLCASNRHLPGSFKLSIFACLSGACKELAVPAIPIEND